MFDIVSKEVCVETERLLLRPWSEDDGVELQRLFAAHTTARRVMEKAGLTYQGARYWLNPEVPVVWYAIDRAAWHARKTAKEAR
jgi:RimJ/RimL family protein N-acetyltransferase